jgi:hypothetical protein
LCIFKDNGVFIFSDLDLLQQIAHATRSDFGF